MTASASTPSVVAITGAQTYLGTELLRQLSDDPSIDHLIAIDLEKPDVISDKLSFYRVDLSDPKASAKLAAILEETRPDTFVHGAFFSSPIHSHKRVHEVENKGTARVLAACAQIKLSRFVLLSTTLAYGAQASNPAYLAEDADLLAMSRSGFVKDKIEAEQQVMKFAERNPAVRVCSLRFAPILGPQIVNLFTRFLSRPLAPNLAGRDPLIQCVHERDAVRATLLALRSDCRGVYNIVGKGVLPYTTLLAVLGRLPFTMPTAFARAIGRVMWSIRISEVPVSLIDYLQFSWVADGSKAEKELGFSPQFDIRETLYDFLGTEQSPQHASQPRY